jgi:lipopolysaccharide exporter
MEGGASARSELRAAAVHGLRWTSIGRVTIELAMLGSMVVLARLIPPAEFGPYAVAVVVQELALGIQLQGVGNALVQRRDALREHFQAGFALALLSGTVLGGLTLLCAHFIAEPIFGTPTASLVAMLAPLPLLSALGIAPTSTLRRNLAFRRLAMIDTGSSLLRAGGAIALAAAGLGARSLVIASLAAAAAGSAAAWASAPPPAPRLRGRAARELLSFGLPASLASISWTCFRNCDYAIVGARLGTLQAGLYFRAYQLGVEYQKKVSDMMVTVAFPVLARTSNAAELSEMRGEVVRLLTMMLFPLLTLLAIVAPVLIPWLLGSSWSPAVLPTQILAIGGASTLVIDTAGVALAAQGRSRAMLGFGIAHFVVYAAAVWIVAPTGIAGVAIAAAVVHTGFLLVSYSVMLAGSSERALKQVCIDVAPATLASIGLALVSVPAALALSAANTPVLVQVAVVSLLGGAAYVATLRAGFPVAWRALSVAVARIVPLGRRRGRGSRSASTLAGARSPG